MESLDLGKDLRGWWGRVCMSSFPFRSQGSRLCALHVQAVLWCGQDLSDFSSVGALEQVLAEMARAGPAAVLAVVVLACALGARADGSDHKYKEGDHVPLYANKVGPFHNPRYSTLLQC